MSIAESFTPLLGEGGALTRDHKMENEAVPLLRYSFYRDVISNRHYFIISSFHFPGVCKYGLGQTFVLVISVQCPFVLELEAFG